MRITATFLDEISHDIPSQNWGIEEWDRDFQYMKAVGIDTVVMIRAGHQKWISYPSAVLRDHCGAYEPSVDLVKQFLELAEKYDMKLLIGLYDGYGCTDDYERIIRENIKKEMDVNRRVVDELWQLYGDLPAFGGWYLSQEVSRRNKSVMDLYVSIGNHCKSISGGLPVMISPYIDGIKSVSSKSSQVAKNKGITPEQHEKEWGEIMDAIAGAVDIVAFQDGHVDFSELPEFLEVNKSLASKYGLSCWSNSETFDRDMPIKFLPIKWEKLRLKLEAAEKAGIDKVLTFEFSHFLSPNSCYPQARGLFRRYCEYAGVVVPDEVCGGLISAF